MTAALVVAATSFLARVAASAAGTSIVATTVEGHQVDPAAALSLAHEQAGDEEPRQDEEDVHADVAAGHARDGRVIQEDQDHRHRPEALEVGAKAVGLVGGAPNVSSSHEVRGLPIVWPRATARQAAGRGAV
jgi:hypothetical protein